MLGMPYTSRTVSHMCTEDSLLLVSGHEAAILLFVYDRFFSSIFNNWKLSTGHFCVLKGFRMIINIL